MNLIHCTIIIAGTLFHSATIPAAASSEDSDPSVEERASLTRYEPNPAYPFGRPNPDAPPELAQFDFMIGEFDCIDEIRSPDGKWNRTVAIWNASYFLNGHGIQDQYWCDTFATSNIRIFDPERGKWFVNFVMMPSQRVGAGQHIGSQVETEDGPTMVMWAGAPDRKNGSRLTFYDITDNGFEWVAESIRNGQATPTWKSSCRRRKRGREPAAPKFFGFDPTPAQPFGARHPNDPAQVDQLSFQIGQFVSRTEGERSRAELVTSTRMLNGWAIQERTYGEGRYTSTLRLFDVSQNHWRSIRFQMPDYQFSIWDGKKEKDGFLLLKETQANNAPPLSRPRSIRMKSIVEGVYERSTTSGAKDGKDKTSVIATCKKIRP